MIGKDIGDGLTEALNKAKGITSKFLEDSNKAWAGWRPGDSNPVVECEEFDYDRKFAETIVNSCYNSFSNGTITVPSVTGEYPLVPTGIYTSSSPAICSWQSGTDIQSHIANIISALNGSVPELGEEFDSDLALQKFAKAVSDEIFVMVTSGTISANMVSGIFKIPSSPPVESIVLINVKGSLSGSNALLTASIYAALKLCDNILIANGIGSAVESFCKSLKGTVVGQMEASLCAGEGIGFVIV